MPRVELVYDQDCPHVPEARDQLRRAFDVLGWTASWDELSDESTMPEHARGYGSPTILVDGIDVSGQPARGTCCRVYPDEKGQLKGVPSVREIVRALAGGHR